MTVESSKIDYNDSRSHIIGQKKKAKTQFTECSFCEMPIQSKAILLRCQHPACLNCAKDFFKDPKDVKCPSCNYFQHMLAKFYSCLSDAPQTTLKDLAEVAVLNSRKQLPTRRAD